MDLSMVLEYLGVFVVTIVVVYFLGYALGRAMTNLKR